MRDTESGDQVTKRDAEATKERILKVGIKEFGASGYSGSRIQMIANEAGCNIRMIYHYFGSKEGLYLAVLERTYGNIRESEERLGFTDLEPEAAIRALVEFTFDHHQNNPEFVDLVVVENVHRGKHLKTIKDISKQSNRLIDDISIILEKGARTNVFRGDVDAFQLYVSILSLSFFHLSNSSTLSIMYHRKLHDDVWRSERRHHVTELILGYLRSGIKSDVAATRSAQMPAAGDVLRGDEGR